MEADSSNVHFGPVRQGSETGTPPQGELVEQLRTEVSAPREHIEHAKMNCVEPYGYLKASLVAIGYCHPASKLDQLLRWAVNSASC